MAEDWKEGPEPDSEPCERGLSLLAECVVFVEELQEDLRRAEEDLRLAGVLDRSAAQKAEGSVQESMDALRELLEGAIRLSQRRSAKC